MTSAPAVAAAALGLNRPIIQLVNYVAYPGQLLALRLLARRGQRNVAA